MSAEVDKLKAYILKNHKHGDDCTCKKLGEGKIVKGKISIWNNEKVYICTNSQKFDGHKAADKLGFRYSWSLNDAVKDLTIIKPDHVFNDYSIY